MMDGSVKLNRNETLVLDALRAESVPLTAYQLLDRLRPAGVKAPLQIYRALRSLSERGMAHRLDSLNAFMACAHAHAHHHHRDGHALIFAICENCGQVEELADAAVDRRLTDLAAEHGFAMSLSGIEMRGRCARCRTDTPAAVNA